MFRHIVESRYDDEVERSLILEARTQSILEHGSNSHSKHMVRRILQKERKARRKEIIQKERGRKQMVSNVLIFIFS